VESGKAIGARLACRDDSALEDAYATYGPAVLAYLRRYVGPDEAEDVLQRTFLDVWRSAERYDTRQRFSGWLFTIAHRRAVDSLRSRRQPVVDVEQVRGLVGEDGRETADRYADAADLRVALDGIAEHERVVLELAYFADLTQREIAERLGIPLGTVKTRASRGLRHLGEKMRDQEGGGEA
jgi:RNA polymerase sigma factor (sigma-70 family)